MTIKATFTPNVHLRKQLQGAFDEGAKEIAREVAKEADRTVPVLTGFLKRSRYIRRLGFGKFGRYRLGYSAFYAKYVHDGTSRQAAQPWLQRAIDKVRGRASRIAAKAIRVRLRQASSPARRPPGR